MKNKHFCLLWASVCAGMLLSVASCEKILPTESDDSEGGAVPNVVLRVSQFESVPFNSRTRSNLDEVCTKLCFDIYDEEGQKVKYINQKLGDTQFGEASLSLPEGDYHLVVIAHSSAKNPSFATKEMKVTASGTLSELFWAYEPLHVTDGNVNKNVILQRIVSMVRFLPDDEMPEEANELLVKYTGSKGTFSGMTGYGTTRSSQSIVVDVSPDDDDMSFYMVPRKERDTLVNVSVISRYNDGSSATQFSEIKIDSIPVRRNCITLCRGSLFNGKTSSGGSVITIDINKSWGETLDVKF